MNIPKFNLRLWFAAVCTAVLCCACNGVEHLFSKTEEGEKEDIQILDIQFSPEWDTLQVTMNVLSNLNNYSILDSSHVGVQVTELIGKKPLRKSMQPELIDIDSRVYETSVEKDMVIRMLVDLTLPQELVDAERDAAKRIYNTYAEEHCYVSFMYDYSHTEDIPVTEYLLEKAFVSREGSGKCLYRSIVEERLLPMPQDCHYPSIMLVVMSDGAVYDENGLPMDEDQFTYQSELTKEYPDFVRDTMSIYYINFDNTAGGLQNDAEPIMRIMARNYDGLYQDAFNWVVLKRDIKRAFSLQYPDYTFTLLNPSLKAYCGREHTLKVEVFSSDGTLLASGTQKYDIGSMFRPVIVNGLALGRLLIQGLVLGILLLFALWLVLQFLVPFIRYRLFLKKYVTEFTGSSMTFNNHIVGEKCWLCKDDFEPGDKIVVKCKHAVHQHCWEESGHHCPEYGRHCQDGSHYYNRKNTFDLKNAPSYAKWVWAGVIAALCAWILYTAGAYNTYISNIFYAYYKHASADTLLYSRIDGVPFLGLCMGLCFTCAFCCLIIRKQKWYGTVLSILLRTFIAAFLCVVLFNVENEIVLAFQTDKNYLFDWIPWMLSGLVIELCCTVRTRVVTKRLYMLCAIAAGFLCLCLYNVMAGAGLSSGHRIIMLAILLVYSVSIALCIAHDAPKSEHYFLALKDGIKPIDVALYKWFATEPRAVVTIGKSVDCTICMSWEIVAEVEPIQAEIRRWRGKLCLFTVEPGVVYRKKVLKAGKRIILQHGVQFAIGNTSFTYLEKDRYG